MAQIFPAGSVNLAAIAADDLYIQIVNPPSFIRGVPTDVFGLVGTASWGKVNIPIHLGSGQDAVQNFGQISAASLTDIYDMATDLALCFGQSSNQSSLEGYGVRVTDGTDTAATDILAGVANKTETATITGSVAAGDVLNVVITDTVVTGSPFTITYTCVAGDTVAIIAAALAASINANATLASVFITATSALGVLTINYPTTATVTFTQSVSPGSETITLANGSTNSHGLSVTANCTGVLGNNITLTIAAGSATSTYTATVTPFYGSSEVFPNIPAAGFWTNLKNALNTGLSTFRGPSQFVIGSNPLPSVGNPTLGTFSLAGGTDGRAGVVTATLLGSDTAQPRTGLYALRQQQPAIGVVWIVGSVDTTLVPSLVQFGQSEGCSELFPFPTGTSTATATAAVATNGQHDSSLAYVKDFLYFFDTINNVTRLVPPTAVIGGEICTLTPEQSPGNKPVSLVLGTERNNPISGNQPYTQSEIGQLENAGIMLITNPIPAGSQFGIRHGQTTSLSPATAPFEYWRMTSYLARSLAATMGQYVDQLQSQQPNDPLRQTIRMQLNNFLNELEGLGQIDGFQVNCNFSSSPSAKPGLGMNTPASVAQHYLYALVQVTYLSSVRFFIISLQGGTTVVTSTANPGQAPAGS